MENLLDLELTKPKVHLLYSLSTYSRSFGIYCSATVTKDDHGTSLIPEVTCGDCIFAAKKHAEDRIKELDLNIDSNQKSLTTQHNRLIQINAKQRSDKAQ